jgi:hypothetical protein
MSLPAAFALKAANGKTIEIPSVGFGTWAAGLCLSIPLNDQELIFFRWPWVV